MVLQFTKDPQTGVVVPPITVFNGGKRRTRKGRKGSKKTRKGKKMTRRR